MSQQDNMIGRRFSLLVVIEQAPSITVGRAGGKRRAWRCQCDCGATLVVATNRLTTGNATSCGCGEFAARSAAKRTHGHTSGGRFSRTFETWRGMMERCSNSSHRSFASYGGRGITVCDRWRTFENFLADMGERPRGRSLDRVDNSKGYEPKNCRWATAAEQARNTSRTRLSPSDVNEIRGRYEHGEFQSSIGKRFGIAQARVSRIVRGESWA